MKGFPMNIIFLSVISMLMLTPTQSLFAGGVDGGGGSGVRCGNKLKLLDLYEANKRGLTVSHSPKKSR